MTVQFFSAASLISTINGSLAGEGDRARWEVADQHGVVLCGPYAAVQDGVYRVKARARAHSGQSYFEVIDIMQDGRLYGARLFQADPELYIRVYESRSLEFRFRTHGETLVVDGVELEPILLDQAFASTDHIRSVLDRLTASDAEPAAVHRLIDRLAFLGEVAEAESRRAAFIDSRTRERPEAEVWRRMLSLNRPLPGSALSPASPVRIRSEDIPPVTQSLPLTVHDLLRVTPETEGALAALGFQAHHITATRLHRDYDEPRRLWTDDPARPEGPGRFPPRQPLFERYIDIDRSYQTAMARGLGFPAYCPVSGQLLRSRHGFLVHKDERIFIFYRFEGVETFYVCTGADSDTRMFVYVPRTGSIFVISDPWHRVYPFEQLVRDLSYNLVLNYDACVRYLQDETTPVAVTGNFNYGHFVWCDLSGLQFAISNGLLPALAGVVNTPVKFIEPELIFPELGAKSVVYAEDQAVAFRHCVENTHLPIHFTDVAMSDELVERFRRNARALASPEGRPPADLPRPLLWLNLRAHNKIWASQVEGYANILNTVLEEYGAASALLDGVPDCADLAAAIRARTRPEVVLHDGLHFSPWDKINWGMACDAYVCVIGTGLILVHTLAGAKGVAHGNREHLDQLRFWESIHPGSGAPIGPTEDQVSDFGEGLQRDYDVDWRVLMDLLRHVLGDPAAFRARQGG